MRRRRIRFDISKWGLGNYQIQLKKYFLGIPYWTGTHRCASLEDAERVLQYIQQQEPYKQGAILKEV